MSRAGKQRPTAHRTRAADALARATGTLSTTAMGRMESEMSWFGSLGAQDKSWVGVIVQAGIRGFVDWYRARATGPEPGGSELAAAIFGSAPRALTGIINLQQTVDLIRLSISVVEENVDEVLDPADRDEVHAAILQYAREVAFATAMVYARAAEQRGAWDARLEALVVDAVLRAEPDEAVLSRAGALGWPTSAPVTVVLGAMPTERTHTDIFEEVRRVAQQAHLSALCASQGDRLVVLLGGVADPERAAAEVTHLFAPGPVVVGPVRDDLSTAHHSARAAMSAYRAASGWPEAPRPVRSDELLVERALAGDGHARRHLVENVHLPLAQNPPMVETLAAYLDAAGRIEATGRVLFVHPNTVRYRLRQVTELTGLVPSDARDAFTLRVALVLGRQSRRSTD